jgi:hypothetical protein
MPLRNDSLGFDIFVRRHPFFTFSSGPFTGFGDNLRNEVWGWQPQSEPGGIVTDTSKYKLVSGGSTGSMAGIAAYANIGMKLWKWFGLSFSTGAGISIESSPRPAFLVGVSLDFGKQQVLSLSGGLIATYADRLNTSMYPDLSTIYDNKEIVPISYSKVGVTGAYVSMTYTLFTLNKQHSVKSGGKK